MGLGDVAADQHRAGVLGGQPVEESLDLVVQQEVQVQIGEPNDALHRAPGNRFGEEVRQYISPRRVAGGRRAGGAFSSRLVCPPVIDGGLMGGAARKLDVEV